MKAVRPLEWESPGEALAALAVITYREWLPDGADLVGSDWSRWEAGGWEWLTNLPEGPSTEGVAAIEAAIERFGVENIRTGNAADPELRAPRIDQAPIKYAPHQVGLYVRKAEAS